MRSKWWNVQFDVVWWLFIGGCATYLFFRYIFEEYRGYMLTASILLVISGSLSFYMTIRRCKMEIESKENEAVQWVKYDFHDPDSRPPNYGKYFVCRKDGKVHWETWNGNGWAYNENVITHWMEVFPPC